MNKQIRIILLSVALVFSVQAQVVPLVELAIQQYSQNIPELLNDLAAGKINADLQDVIKKKLIQQYLDLFPVATQRVFKGHTNIVHSVAFSSDGTQALTESWDLQTGQTIQQSINNKPLYPFAFSPDRTQVLIGGIDGAVHLRDLSTSTILKTLKDHTHHRIKAVAFNPVDRTQALTGSQDRIARLWDLNTGKILALLVEHTGPICSAAFSPDGTQVLTGSEDRTARLWDLATGQTIKVLQGHTALINLVTFSSDGTKALTGSDDCTARFWDLSTGQTIAILKGHTNGVVSVAFNPVDKTQALTGSIDRTVRLWDLDYWYKQDLKTIINKIQTS